MSILTAFFGDANRRFLNSLREPVESINALENTAKSLSDADLRAKTAELREKIRVQAEHNASDREALEAQLKQTVGEEDRRAIRARLIEVTNQPLGGVLSEAFALVREAARRTLGQRHFDVQLMGGIVLHRGQIAEMKTGEGKTLTSTLAIYLNALLGRGVHVITVNDYLAKRDATWMGQVYHALGLTVGVIVHETSYSYDPTSTTTDEDHERDQGVRVEQDFLRIITRKEAYQADITYGTNNEFGFDYLRDNMAGSLEQKVQRELHYAIIDEVDSILIDEARTPLIISAQDNRSTERYYQFAKIVEGLEEKSDYVIDEKLRAATLTEQGISKVEKILNVENLYVEQGIQTVHHIEQALKAKTLFKKDRDYTVKDGQVLIVDEFTGRILLGRRYSEGLHQAIEAKEGLEIQKESRTMATVTFQNYFRLYHKLAGMTGTAETEAEELAKIYGLEVTAVPTNKLMIRKDMPDRIYKNETGKFKAIVDEIKERNSAGQPVLVGTISIEKNERLAELLAREGLSFNTLNAKQHEREAEVIAQAGARGAITIATNMAGRGVDIKLGGLPQSQYEQEEILKLGGLHVMGTERHESRRIDNQLRGRSGRQGEPGSSQFYVSLEDDLMRIFGAERVKGVMKNWPDDMPIENGFISKSLESAQKRVEGHNFDIRKHLVEYDDVVNKQRMYIYALRDRWLQLAGAPDDEVRMNINDEITEEIKSFIGFHIPEGIEARDTQSIEQSAGMLVPLTKEDQSALSGILTKEMTAEVLREELGTWLETKTHEHVAKLQEGLAKAFANDADAPKPFGIIIALFLRSLDMLWVDHLETINYLRTGIGLRGYGQRDPLIEYRRESKDLFTRLLDEIRRNFVYSVMNLGITPRVAPHKHSDGTVHMHEQKVELNTFSGTERKEAPQIETKAKDSAGHKIGRNDLCYCGSGKKYKKCHGA